MNNRPLIIFLLANFIIGVFVIINFRNKAEENKIIAKNEIITETAEENRQQKLVSTVATTKSPKISEPVVATPVENASVPAGPAICMEYGPLDIEQKSIFDTLVAKEKINPLVAVSQKNQFEIYWNLGNNQAQANEMFERQKKDALQDKKFQLAQENGTWIVSIAVVNDNIETAKVLAAQLSEKATKVNAGGKWQYRTLPDAYYYQVKNINAMTPNSQAQITTGMGIGKKPCSA
jgi:hypothetical protein